MKLADFRETLSSNEPPTALSIYAQALWYDAKGDWDKAHDLFRTLPIKMRLGYMPTCTEKKGMFGTPITGTTGPDEKTCCFVR